MFVLPSINDKILKNGYRGEVYLFGNGRRKTIAVVYGDTLEEMRSRKHAVTAALKEAQEDILDEMESSTDIIDRDAN